MIVLTTKAKRLVQRDLNIILNYSKFDLYNKKSGRKLTWVLEKPNWKEKKIKFVGYWNKSKKNNCSAMQLFEIWRTKYYLYLFVN